MNRTVLLAVLAAAPLSAQGWPEVYDPLTMLELELELDPADWDVVVQDETFDVEVPALFGVAGEPKMLVSVRRKSAVALGEKVSLKIDVNEYVSGQLWHGVEKLSLENGDDVNVIAEGFAWYLHRRAAQISASDDSPGLASWIALSVNGEDLGVYVNVEQPDDRMLKNRGWWVDGETWLYKTTDIGGIEIEEGEPDSPTFQALCYAPFAPSPSCAMPTGAALVGDLDGLIDLQGLMTLAATSALHNGPDQMFTKGKNFLYADFLSMKRQYFPWDLDVAFWKPDESIYPGSDKPYAVLLEEPLIAAQYEAALAELLGTAFQLGELYAFLDALGAVIGAAVDADPNNNLDGTAAEELESLKHYLVTRVAKVSAEIGWIGPPSCGAIPYAEHLGGANVAALACPIAPSVGGALQLALSGVPDGGGLIVLGSQAHAPFAGGTLVVGGPLLLVAPVAVAGGSGDLFLPIPNAPELAGLRAFAQGAAPDPAQPHGWAFSGGLKLVMCP